MKRNKNEKKLNNFIWFLFGILPIVIYLIMTWQNTVTDFSAFIVPYRFDFLYNILVDISDLGAFNLPTILIGLVSYLFSVELCRLFFECIVFFIRLPRHLIGVVYDKID